MHKDPKQIDENKDNKFDPKQNKIPLKMVLITCALMIAASLIVQLIFNFFLA